MKIYVLSVFFVLGNYLFPATKQVKQLPLLIPRDNFKTEILNGALENNLYSSDVIMLRVKKSEKNKQSNDSENYELRITTLEINVFELFSFKKDKYFGYFEYKKHVVLVYGDENIGYFFSKTKTKKQFDFLSFKPYDFKNNPPISIEPVVFLYHFKKSQFTLIDASMLLGFWE